MLFVREALARCQGQSQLVLKARRSARLPLNGSGSAIFYRCSRVAEGGGWVVAAASGAAIGGEGWPAAEPSIHWVLLQMTGVRLSSRVRANLNVD